MDGVVVGRNVNQNQTTPTGAILVEVRVTSDLPEEEEEVEESSDLPTDKKRVTALAIPNSE